VDLGAALDASTDRTSVVALSSPVQNSAGRVVFAWDQPGDVIPFELTLEVPGEPARVRAELWTNAGHNADPTHFEALPMHPVGRDGDRITFRVDVPIEHIGNYRATARFSTDGGERWSWAGDQGFPDLRFRPHDEAHDRLSMMELNISSVNGGHGTLDDLSGPGSPWDGGRYTLEFLASEGISAVWVQPPFQRNLWEHRHPLDDAGSPYATKDYFAVDTSLSARAQRVLAAGGSQAEAQDAALQEWKDFVAKAHSLGMKVVVDVALNHVGHDFQFADLFTWVDEQGQEHREVRRDDYSQIATSPAQLAQIEGRLAGPGPHTMERVAPWLYSSRSGDPDGAQSEADVLAGGGQWFDTKQLNHGGSYGVANPEINTAVSAWLGRVLEFWAVDMEADGFRLDHLTGLPDSVLEGGLNHAQAAVDAHRPGVNLYLTGEDFFNAEYFAPWLDSIQDTWMRNALTGNLNPGAVRGLLSNPYFANRELLNLSSHDEERFDFHGDMRAAGRMASLLQLFGGTSMLVAGDELGEAHGMPFKQHRPVGAIQTPSPAGAAIVEQLGRAARAKAGLPALADDNRSFLDPMQGGYDADLLALARVPDADKEGNPVVVAAHMGAGASRENAFRLDATVTSRLQARQRYQIRDVLAGDPDAPLWSEPKTGRQLRDEGLFVRLEPYQVQALEIYPVP
jgi:glycosidase